MPTFPYSCPVKNRLTVAPGGRVLEDESGEPFFWLADTAWELFHRLSHEEVGVYFENRRKKEFTVIQAVILAELDGIREPNFYGYVPFEDGDPGKIVERYFENIDWVIEKAASCGLYMALLPTWGDKVNRRYDWASGPEIFTPENSEAFGYFLGQRYKNSPNVVWIMGGDRDPDERAVEIWRNMAGGIIRGCGGKENTLMSFHPQPFGSGSSSRWFHHDDWLDFNMLQTGHDRQKNTFDQIASDYSLTPAKPVIDGEPTYEAHGLSFLPFEKGYSSDAEVRKFAYWSLFSGAFGHTYGCHSVWQFYTRERKGINFPLYEWKDALDLSGANQMRHLKQLAGSRSFTDRTPDQSLIVNNQPKGENYCTAIRDARGTYAFVYSPTGTPLEVNTLPLYGKEIAYRWFNPRDGIYSLQARVDKLPVLRFQPPNRGYGNDWVLVIDCLD